MSGFKSSVARYSLILARQSSRQPSLIKPVSFSEELDLAKEAEEIDSAELDITDDTEEAGFTELEETGSCEEETASAEELDPETARLEDTPEMGMLIWSPESILALVPDESSEQAEKNPTSRTAKSMDLKGFFIIALSFSFSRNGWSSWVRLSRRKLVLDQQYIHM